MVWQETVNLPTYVTIGSIPITSTMFGLKVFMDARQPVTLKEGDRYPLGPPDLSACNVNLVDGLVWSQEAVGSNPTTQTKFWRVGRVVKAAVC